MANKDIQMKKFNGTDFDLLRPLTVAKNVEVNNGDTVEHALMDSSFYDGVHYEKLNDSVTGTDYVIATIPHLDENNEVIRLKRGFAKDVPNGGGIEKARDFSKRHNATVSINASIFDTTTFKLLGMQIYNGQVLNVDVNPRPDRYILGIKDSDNTLVYYQPTTTAQTIINDGCSNALTGFIPLINGGLPVSDAIIQSYTAHDWKYRRHVIAQMANKDIIILSCEGDYLNNVGLDCYDVIRILSAKGVKFAFMLDGGGSMQTVVRGLNLVTAKDDNGKTERQVPDFLYFSKQLITKRDSDISESNFVAGEAGQKANEALIREYEKTDFNKGYARLMGADGYKTHGIEVWEGTEKQFKLGLNEELFFFNYLTSQFIFNVDTNGDIKTKKGMIGSAYQYTPILSNANDASSTGFYWLTNSSSNSPNSSLSWGVISIHLNTQAALQFAICFSSPFDIKKRRKNGGTWDSTWE